MIRDAERNGRTDSVNCVRKQVLSSWDFECGHFTTLPAVILRPVANNSRPFERTWYLGLQRWSVSCHEHGGGRFLETLEACLPSVEVTSLNTLKANICEDSSEFFVLCLGWRTNRAGALYMSCSSATDKHWRKMIFKRVAKKQLLTSSCLSVCPSVWNNSAATGKIFVKFYAEDSYIKIRRMSRKFIFNN